MDNQHDSLIQEISSTNNQSTCYTGYSSVIVLNKKNSTTQDPERISCSNVSMKTQIKSVLNNNKQSPTDSLVQNINESNIKQNSFSIKQNECDITQESSLQLINSSIKVVLNSNSEQSTTSNHLTFSDQSEENEKFDDDREEIIQNSFNRIENNQESVLKSSHAIKTSNDNCNNIMVFEANAELKENQSLNKEPIQAVSTAIEQIQCKNNKEISDDNSGGVSRDDSLFSATKFLDCVLETSDDKLTKSSSSQLQSSDTIKKILRKKRDKEFESYQYLVQWVSGLQNWQKRTFLETNCNDLLEQFESKISGPTKGSKQIKVVKRPIPKAAKFNEDVKIIDYIQRDEKILYKIDQRGKGISLMTSNSMRKFFPVNLINFLESKVHLRHSLPFESIVKFDDKLKNIVNKKCLT